MAMTHPFTSIHTFCDKKKFKKMNIFSHSLDLFWIKKYLCFLKLDESDVVSLFEKSNILSNNVILSKLKLNIKKFQMKLNQLI
jgi:hypothetical protein